MSDHARDRRIGDRRVSTDLVEYFIVALPSVDSLGEVVVALTALMSSDTLRILDAVAIRRQIDSTIEVFELDSIAGLVDSTAVGGTGEGLLSDRDIHLASLVIRPGTAGLVLVCEDRWAQSLATAAARAGGRIIAGERIPAARIEAVLAEAAERANTDSANDDIPEG